MKSHEVKFYLQPTIEGSMVIDKEVGDKREHYRTIDSFSSRSGILHIKAGTNGWEPSEEDLRELCEMFISAAMHPDLSIVATKQGVDVSFIPFT